MKVLYKDCPYIVLALSIAFLVLAETAFADNNEKRLTLEESLEMALKSSAALHAAQERVREAEARKKEAKSAFFPRISTSYSYTRLNPPPYLNFPGFPPAVPPGSIVIGT